MDVVVTVPRATWEAWLREGGLPGEDHGGQEYFFRVPRAPNIRPGQRVYVVAHGKLRGYAPLVRLQRDGSGCHLVRRGGAVAHTIPEPVPGFRCYRYRWWDRTRELPFPTWREV